eukprot:12326963-Alexandrium_andersonii.AAC.1
MSASLVGSEMCIRDSTPPLRSLCLAMALGEIFSGKGRAALRRGEGPLLAPEQRQQAVAQAAVRRAVVVNVRANGGGSRRRGGGS